MVSMNLEWGWGNKRGGVPHLICTRSKENVSLLSKARARSWRVLLWDQRADNQKVSHPLVGDRQFWNTTRTVPDRRIYFTLSMSLLGAVFTGSSLGALRALRHPYEPWQITVVFSFPLFALLGKINKGTQTG